MQELGQNQPKWQLLDKVAGAGTEREEARGAKSPQTEAKKFGSSGASCEAENTRGLGLYNIQTFDVCILSNRAWRHSLATPLRAGVSKLRVKLRLRGLAASLGVARLTCVRRRVGGRV